MADGDKADGVILLGCVHFLSLTENLDARIDGDIELLCILAFSSSRASVGVLVKTTGKESLHPCRQLKATHVWLVLKSGVSCIVTVISGALRTEPRFRRL